MNMAGNLFNQLVKYLTIKMDRAFKNTPYKILELFMEDSGRDFSVRGIARLLKISHATVLNHLGALKHLDLIRKKSSQIYPLYYANTESAKLKFYKKSGISFKILESGLIEHLRKETAPASIILFGSCAKGTYTNKSDIDIFVEAPNTKVDISKFEKKLKRTINILFEAKIGGLSAELRNNILNGIVLDGFIRL